MESVRLDHIVVGAGSLEEGAAYVAELLGVMPSGGGEHSSMGTHNRVLRLGGDCYLEVIAINPGAPAPARPRWFELDAGAMKEKLACGPKVITWALRTDRIDDLSRRCGGMLGKVEPMSRGDLHWRLTLTEDGSLPGAGLIPFLIQWEKTPHIAAGMPESGCRLAGLYGFHPRRDGVAEALRQLGAGHLIDLKDTEFEPALSVAVETPGGLRMLA